MRTFEDMDKEWQEILENEKDSSFHSLASKFYELFSIVRESCEKRGIMGVDDEPEAKEEPSNG